MGMGLLCPQDHPLGRQRASAGCAPSPTNGRGGSTPSQGCMEQKPHLFPGNKSPDRWQGVWIPQGSTVDVVICHLTTVCMCPLLNTYVKLRQAWTNWVSPLKRGSLPSLLLHALGS